MRIVIEVKGGLVAGVWTEGAPPAIPAYVTVADYDTDGVEADLLRTDMDGETYYRYTVDVTAQSRYVTNIEEN